MKTKRLLSTLLLISTTALAEVPSEVSSQFGKDIRLMMETKGTGNISEEQVSAAVASMVDQAITQHPTAFEYTTEEIEAFRTDRTLYTDTQIKESYNELKVLADGRPMPVLTETYFNSFEAGSLTPKQKIVFQKLTLAIIKYTKEQLKK